MRKYYITGVLASMITGYSFLAILDSWGLYYAPPLLAALCALPGGLLAGYTGSGLEKISKIDKTSLKLFGLVIFTIFLSILYSTVLMVLWFLLSLWLTYGGF